MLIHDDVTWNPFTRNLDEERNRRSNATRKHA
jgi:hypothetical protein